MGVFIQGNLVCICPDADKTVAEQLADPDLEPHDYLRHFCKADITEWRSSIPITEEGEKGYVERALEERRRKKDERRDQEKIALREKAQKSNEYEERLLQLQKEGVERFGFVDKLPRKISVTYRQFLGLSGLEEGHVFEKSCYRKVVSTCKPTSCLIIGKRTWEEICGSCLQEFTFGWQSPTDGVRIYVAPGFTAGSEKVRYWSEYKESAMSWSLETAK